MQSLLLFQVAFYKEVCEVLKEEVYLFQSYGLQNILLLMGKVYDLVDFIELLGGTVISYYGLYI